MIEEIEQEVKTQARRWVFTINNPMGENIEEVDISKTDLPIQQDYYSQSVLSELQETNCFDFKYIKISIKKDEFTSEDKVILRPFFKSYEHIEKYISNLEHVKYAVYQLEQGENETIHIQGAVIFSISKRFKTVKGYLPMSHLEKAKGSNTQVRDYCTKKETRIKDPVEIGEFVEERGRTDRKEFVNMILSGMSDSELMQLDSNNFLSTNDNKISRIRESLYDKYRTEYRSVDVTFIYGASGTGKTTYLAKKLSPKDAFDVTNYDNSMFTNYNYQDNIIMDEFQGTMAVRTFNLLTGFKPIDLRGLGVAKVSAFHHIYIISNYSLPEIIKKMAGEDYRLYKTIDRRINKIIHFKSRNEIVVERDSEWEEVSEEDKQYGFTIQVKKTWQVNKYGDKQIIYDRYADANSLTPVDDENILNLFKQETQSHIDDDLQF